MSVSQYQDNVNRLDKEIADLEAKRAKLNSESASLQAKILSVQKSITKSTSLSSLQSKQRQIANYQNDIAKKNADAAKTEKAIADKRKRRLDEYQKLQKAQAQEDKKQIEASKRMQQSYERKINDLNARLLNQAMPKAILTTVSNDVDSDKTEYDVFISHASEDKTDFVDELAAEIEKLGIKAWYDKNNIGWGDSIRERIDEGLRKSKFGIVILSPSYIAEGKYWTKVEFNSFYELEAEKGKFILPIWHKLTKKEVSDYSPTISNKNALSTANFTPKEIAEKLKELLSTQGAD